MFTTTALDLLCVAAHYSRRYGGSDLFMQTHCGDHAMQARVFYLRDKSKDDVVRVFVDTYLQRASGVSEADVDRGAGPGGGSVVWKDMQYLWRHFLEAQNLPAILFQQELKERLIAIFSPGRADDGAVFRGVTSKYLPIVEKFLQFWEESVVADECESDLEIDELAFVFRTWCGDARGAHAPFLSEHTILDLVTFYYPHVEIEQDKFLQGVRCILWDKQLSIRTAMAARAESELVDESMYDTYVFYCDFYASDKVVDMPKYYRQTVSKPYFEKFVDCQ
jgi:hypothetical protein